MSISNILYLQAYKLYLFSFCSTSYEPNVISQGNIFSKKIIKINLKIWYFVTKTVKSKYRTSQSIYNPRNMIYLYRSRYDLVGSVLAFKT